MVPDDQNNENKAQTNAELSLPGGSEVERPNVHEGAEFPDTIGFEIEAESPVPPKETIDGDFELVEQIGRGGMGIVYKARQKSLNCFVALKIIPRSLFPSRTGKERFKLEAEAVARVKHRHIVPIHSIGEWQGRPYYTMDIVSGKNLNEILKDSGRMPPQTAATVIEKISRAVHHAHTRGVIHRDLKPANILLDEDAEPWLLDFGLAKMVGREEGLSLTGEIMGTPSYMSPEQAAPTKSQVSIHSDIYSLGATLYALLTGVPPFSGTDFVEVLQQVQNSAPHPLSSHISGLSPDLHTICFKCLSKQPQHRYDSAKEVADELERYLAGRPIRARKIGSMTKMGRWCQRNPLVASLIGATTASLLVGTFASLMFAISANEEAKKSKASELLAKSSEVRAKNMVKDYFVTVSDNVLLDEPGMQPLRNKLLSKAVAYYKQLREDAELTEFERAEASFYYGRSLEELDNNTDAIEAYSSAFHSIDCSRNKLDGYEESKLTLATKIETRLAQMKFAISKEVGDGHAEPKTKSEHMQSALQHSQNVIVLRQELELVSSNKLESARLLANALMNHAAFLYESKQYEEALSLLENATKKRLETINSNPNNRELEVDMATGRYDTARCLLRLHKANGDPSYSERFFETIKTAIDSLKILDSSERSPKTREKIAQCYRLRADGRLSLFPPRLSTYERSEKDYLAAIELFSLLSAESPRVSKYLIQRAECCFNHSHLEFAQGKKNDAVELIEQMVSDYMMVYRRDPAATNALHSLVVTLNGLAELLNEVDQPLAIMVLTQAGEKFKEESRSILRSEALEKCKQKIDDTRARYVVDSDTHRR